MKLTDDRNNTRDRAKKFIKNLDKDIYILGTNKYGVSTANWLQNMGFELKGFINDFVNAREFESYPIYKSVNISQGASIINCIVEGRAIDAEKSINALKTSSNIDYFALQFAFSDSLVEISFLNNTDSIIDNIEEYRCLYSQLRDEESKKTLESILSFRLNREIRYLENFRFRIKEQYFEEFIKINMCEGFIDGGGFDGETSKSFVQLYPDCQHIYYIEPNLESFEKSQKNLKDIAKIKFFKKGLWHTSETLFFDNSLGPASKLSHQGTTTIQTVSIDEVIKSQVSYIKLDIEGAEYNALRGAKKIITEFKPVIAVCVYHNQQDFIRIPELLLNYNPNYRIYLRHYTQGVFETVMYFLEN